jgi:hypothetical protein
LYRLNPGGQPAAGTLLLGMKNAKVEGIPGSRGV